MADNSAKQIKEKRHSSQLGPRILAQGTTGEPLISNIIAPTADTASTLCCTVPMHSNRPPVLWIEILPQRLLTTSTETSTAPSQLCTFLSIVPPNRWPSMYRILVLPFQIKRGNPFTMRRLVTQQHLQSAVVIYE
jgi:hypothetical protein